MCVEEELVQNDDGPLFYDAAMWLCGGLWREVFDATTMHSTSCAPMNNTDRLRLGVCVCRICVRVG